MTGAPVPARELFVLVRDVELAETGRESSRAELEQVLVALAAIDLQEPSELRPTPSFTTRSNRIVGRHDASTAKSTRPVRTSTGSGAGNGPATLSVA
jgi:hypothetical protein